MIRLMKSALKIMEETYPFEVLRATVKCGFKVSANMLERFGFEYESEITEDTTTWYTYIKRTEYGQCPITA